LRQLCDLGINLLASDARARHNDGVLWIRLPRHSNLKKDHNINVLA